MSGLAFKMDRVNLSAAGVVVGCKGTLVGIGIEEAVPGRADVVTVRPQVLVDATVARRMAAALVEAANEVDQGLRRDATMRGPSEPARQGGAVGTGSRRSGGSGGWT